MKSYKVWIHVEEIDEECDHYEDRGLPDSLGEFGTFEDAANFVEILVGQFNPDTLATSDYGPNRFSEVLRGADE